MLVQLEGLSEIVLPSPCQPDCMAAQSQPNCMAVWQEPSRDATTQPGAMARRGPKHSSYQPPCLLGLVLGGVPVGVRASQAACTTSRQGVENRGAEGSAERSAIRVASPTSTPGAERKQGGLRPPARQPPSISDVLVGWGCISICTPAVQQQAMSIFPSLHLPYQLSRALSAAQPAAPAAAPAMP